MALVPPSSRPTDPSAAVDSVFGRTGAVVAGNADYLAVPSGGLTGAVAATRYVGGTASGAPVAGTFLLGDFVVDQTGKVWVCTVAGTPGTWTQAGASSSPWTADVNESGASLSNWTQESGSWSVVSNAFQVTTTALTAQRLKLTAQKRQAGLVYQADVKIGSGGGFTAGSWVGLVFGWDGASTGGTLIALQCTNLTPASSGIVYCEQTQGVAAGGSIVNNFAIDTFVTIGVVFQSAGIVDVYVAGAYVGSFGGCTSDANNAYLGLLARNCIGSFKNVKTSYLTPPTLPL